MSNRRSGSGGAAKRQLTAMRDRLVRTVRRTVGVSASTLLILCERWGDAESRRAAKAFARSIKSARPAPLRWRLDRILPALTSGASDIDASARRLARQLRDLVADVENLDAMARLLGKPTP